MSPESSFGMPFDDRVVTYLSHHGITGLKLTDERWKGQRKELTRTRAALRGHARWDNKLQ